jgi:hypothetical protein
MSRHLKRWLNDEALAALSGVYEGAIDAVVEETVTNRFKRNEDGSPIKCTEPVICFRDGWRLIPNLGARRALIQLLGPDTDAWIGRRLVVTRVRMENSARWEKRVALASDVPTWVTDETDEPGDDPIAERDEERDDGNDVVATLRFGRRR